MQHVMVIIPVDSYIQEAHHIAEENRKQRAQRGNTFALRHLHFQHHDRDDDREHAVAESFKPALAHTRHTTGASPKSKGRGTHPFKNQNRKSGAPENLSADQYLLHPLANYFLRGMPIGKFFDEASKKRFHAHAPNVISLFDSTEKEYQVDVYYRSESRYRHAARDNSMGGLCRRTLPARRPGALRACALLPGPDRAHFPHRSQFPPRTSVLLLTIRPRFPNPRSRPRKPRQNPRRPLLLPPRALDASRERSPRSGCRTRSAAGVQVSVAKPACAPLCAWELFSSHPILLSRQLFSHPTLICSDSLSSVSPFWPCLCPPPPVSLAPQASIGHSLASLFQTPLAGQWRLELARGERFQV